MTSKPKLLGGHSAVRYPFPIWPQSDHLETSLLAEVIKSGEWWKFSGTQVKKFEAEFTAHHGASHGLALTNGTHALELALRCLDIGPGDEVIVPAMTFIATVLPIIKLGASPVPVDICSDDWCMNPTDLRLAISKHTKAIIPVHFAGQICRMNEICEIGNTYGIPIIEDAAHAHGAEWCNQKAGSFGAMAAFSFQNFKLMSSGEGGFLMFNNPDLFETSKLLYNCGRPDGDRDYQHVVLGDNFRMSEFQAAVLNAQLTRLSSQGKVREKNASDFICKINDIEGIKVQQRSMGTDRHSYYMLVFEYDEKAFGGLSRQHFVESLVAEGIPASRIYPLIQDAPFFLQALSERSIKPNIKPCPNGKQLANKGVWIHHRVLLGGSEHIDQLINAIDKIKQHAFELVEFFETNRPLVFHNIK